MAIMWAVKLGTKKEEYLTKQGTWAKKKSVDLVAVRWQARLPRNKQKSAYNWPEYWSRFMAGKQADHGRHLGQHMSLEAAQKVSREAIRASNMAGHRVQHLGRFGSTRSPKRWSRRVGQILGQIGSYK